MKKTVDLRQHCRFDILEFAVLHIEDQKVPAVVVDISLGGLQILTRHACRVGDRATIVIGQGGAPAIRAELEARYSQPVGSGLFAVGLRYLPSSKEDCVALVDYIHDVFRRQGERLI